MGLLFRCKRLGVSNGVVGSTFLSALSSVVGHTILEFSFLLSAAFV